MLVAQPFENPLGRVPLLHRRRLVRLQDCINHRDQRAQLGSFRLLRPHIAWRRRIAAHLRNRIPAQPEYRRRLPSAVLLNEHKLPNRCVVLQGQHPRRLFRSKFESRLTQNGRIFLRPARALRAAHWPDYRSAAHTDRARPESRPAHQARSSPWLPGRSRPCRRLCTRSTGSAKRQFRHSAPWLVSTPEFPKPRPQPVVSIARIRENLTAFSPPRRQHSGRAITASSSPGLGHSIEWKVTFRNRPLPA